MVGHGGMQHGDGDFGHVALQAIVGRIDAATFLGRRPGGVARQTFGFIEGGRLWGIVVGIMARQAGERARALGVAPAGGHGRARRADEIRILRLCSNLARYTHDMTIGTLRNDRRSRRCSGVNDGAVGKTGLDGHDMVLARAMAAFAADPLVGRFGPSPGIRQRVSEVSRLSHMAIQAADDAVADADLLTTETLHRARVGNISQRSIPDYTVRSMVGGQPCCPVRPLGVAANHRDCAVAGAKRIFHNRMVDPIPRACLIRIRSWSRSNVCVTFG